MRLNPSGSRLLGPKGDTWMVKQDELGVWVCEQLTNHQIKFWTGVGDRKTSQILTAIGFRQSKEIKGEDS